FGMRSPRRKVYLTRRQAAPLHASTYRPPPRRSPVLIFRSTHTASAVSSAAPVFLRRSPSSRNNDSLGNRSCPAISFTVFPVARLRSQIDSSAVNRAANPGTAGLALCLSPDELPAQCGFGAL